MHFATSMSFATVPVTGSRTRVCGTVVAESRLISSDCRAISSPLCLLDLHEKRLELGRLRVSVAHGRRESVDEIARLREALEAPVQRQADGVHLLALHGQRLDAF